MPEKRDEIRDLNSIPVGSLGLIPLESCRELGEKVNNYLVKWRKEREHQHKDSLPFDGYERESYILKSRTPRFGTGEAKGVIMDGRDIGTVVFPNAELKIFVTASDEIRAQRRYDELTAKGEKCNMEDIIANIRERDRIDSTRAVSPLRKADDAIILDNSNMTIAEQKAWLLTQFQRVTAG